LFCGKSRISTIWSNASAPDVLLATSDIVLFQRFSDDGNNAITALLRTWKDEAQAILGELEAGRFGIIDASDSDNDLTPIGTGDTAVGLIFQDYTKTNDYNRNRVDITLTFRRSRGLDI